MNNCNKRLWMETQEVLSLLGISRNSLDRLRKRGIVHSGQVPGSRRRYYLRTEIENLIVRNIIDENGNLDLTDYPQPADMEFNSSSDSVPLFSHFPKKTRILTPLDLEKRCHNPKKKKAKS